MDKLIQLFKNLRKKKYLTLGYKGKFAFVGIGQHSMNNLYPILNYLRVPIKYIVVNSQKNAELIKNNFEHLEGTTDFDEVLNDAEIRGVFICANPKSHFSLVKKSLENDKNVFVEKPPCTTSEELKSLIELEKKSKGTCMVGMQKRYSPIVQTLKNKIKNDLISYNYRFITGAYPEGDSVLDLFIHPIDLIVHLFGEFKVLSIQKSKNRSFFIHLNHNGCIGNIELSTEYSWKNAEENMILNTSSGIYSMKNLELLTFEKKSKTIFSIPIEKVKKMDEYVQILYNRNNFNPILDNNQLVTSGYYAEIENFVHICEKNSGENKTRLSDLSATFELMNLLKEQK